MKINFAKSINTRVIVNMIAMAVIVMSISSCNKDDDKGPSNYFTADGTTHALATAQLRTSEDSDKDGAGNTVYHHELVLLSDGFTSTANNITGTGDAVDFTITTSSATLLPAGKYTFTNASAPVAFTFSEGYAYVGFSSTSSTAGTEFEVASGTLTVAISGTTYTLDFEGTTAVSGSTTGKAFSAHYNGTLSVY